MAQSWLFLLLWLLESLVASTDNSAEADSVCPKQCVCKWKRGKESIFCSQAGFYQVPKLHYTGTQVLELIGNPISQLGDEVFFYHNFMNLQEIILSQCQINVIERHAFKELNNLGIHCMDDWEFLIVLSKKVNAQELWQIVLQCEVEANPEPSIQWTWQGTTVINGSQSGMGRTVFHITQWGLRLKTSNLTIRDAPADLGGAFKCIGQNNAGKVQTKLNLVLAKPVMTTTLHKRESKSNSSIGNNPVYVVAGFAGGLVIFVTLFVACCVFSLTTQRPSSMTARPKCFRPSSSLETESLRNSQYDAADITELTRLHVEEEKVTDPGTTTTTALLEPKIRIPAVDEGYKSMSSNTASTPSSCSLISPPQKLQSPDPIEVYEQQQQSLVKDATNRTTPTAALPSISLRSSTSTPSSSHHPPASALRLSSRPLSEHLSSASASMAVAAASPRVRFNLEPMHFEFSDVDDISEDPTTSFKLRDRSPSDPLISLGETVDLRNRGQQRHRVRFLSPPRSSTTGLEHTCGLRNPQPHRWSFNEASSNQWDTFYVEYIGLQDELQRMRDACDNLKQANLRGDLEALKASLAATTSTNTTTKHQLQQIHHPRKPILKRQLKVQDNDDDHMGAAAEADLQQRLLYHRSQHLGQGYYSLDRQPTRRPVQYRHYKPRRLLPQPQPRRYSQQQRQSPQVQED